MSKCGILNSKEKYKEIYCQIDSMNTDEDTYYTISSSFEEFLINMDKELVD